MRKFLEFTVPALICWALILVVSAGFFAYASGYSASGPTVAQVKAKVLKTKIYRSKKLGIEFEYPEKFKVREKNGFLTIEHGVNFNHPAPCDGSGLPKSLNSKKIQDIYIEMSILPLTHTELFLQEVMRFSQSGALVEPVPTTEVTYGSLHGFWVYNGNHGCGPFSYFFQIGDEKVLRVERVPAPEFKEVPESEQQRYRQLSNIILPEDEEFFFRFIISSLVVDGR